jgi:hypothetical protein
MFLGLLDPDPAPLVRGMDPDPALDPDPSITATVPPTAAGERERRANPTAAGKRGGMVESPPHEARSWSLQFSPALPERKDDFSSIYRAVLQD